MTPPSSPYVPHLDISGFAGTWYVVRTNLEFWNERSRRTHPSITYTHRPRTPGEDINAGGVVLGDVVRYRVFDPSTGRSSDAEKTVVGKDTQLGKTGGFRWRGAGPLFLLTSRWGVVAHDPDCAEWAVTHFSATGFTKEGMDIYSRTPTLSGEREREIMERLRSHPQLRDKAVGFFATVHER
ncbi:MAG: hypothetical protein L0Y64_26990 [Myxococcaceae bacterium]|nr:hypothetical protein [Myxococcaceae bacterium]